MSVSNPDPSSTPSGGLPLAPADQDKLMEGLDRDQIGDLIALIRESADKLERDNTSRGDLKIISRTLRELRYAFKVFSPYRSRRKVTIFGTARTPPKIRPTNRRSISARPWLSRSGWSLPARPAASWKPAIGRRA